MIDDDVAAAYAAIERAHLHQMRALTVRRVRRIAGALAGLSVPAWIVLASVDRGLTRGIALALSVGFPLAAVGLAGTAAVSATRWRLTTRSSPQPSPGRAT